MDGRKSLNNLSWLPFLNFILNLESTLNALIIGIMVFVWRGLYNATHSHLARLRNCMGKDLFFQQFWSESQSSNFFTQIYYFSLFITSFSLRNINHSCDYSDHLGIKGFNYSLLLDN